MSFVFAPPQQAVVPVQDETYSYFPIRRVFGIARNYAEPGAATKDTPFYFMKDCYTVVPVADGECARIPMPPQSQVLKHEIELVACLGKGGRNLTLEQAANKLRMGAGHYDFRALETACNIHHIYADTLTVAVAFSRHLLTTGKQRLDIANGHVHIGGVLHVLLHDTGDQLAFLP